MLHFRYRPRGILRLDFRETAEHHLAFEVLDWALASWLLRLPVLEVVVVA